MPTYEYECKSCLHNFDVFQNINDEPIKTCPQCQKQVRRLINGGMGVIFKGSGFYVTDKKNSVGSKPKDTASTDKSNKESSPCANSGCPAAESCPKAV